MGLSPKRAIIGNNNYYYYYYTFLVMKPWMPQKSTVAREYLHRWRMNTVHLCFTIRPKKVSGFWSSVGFKIGAMRPSFFYQQGNT